METQCCAELTKAGQLSRERLGGGEREKGGAGGGGGVERNRVKERRGGELGRGEEGNRDGVGNFLSLLSSSQ